MLTREQAREQLQTFAVPGGRERRLAAAEALPTALRDIAVAFMDDTAGHGWSSEEQRRAQKRQQTMEQVEALSAPERQALFGVLFPTLHRHVEPAWQLLHGLPYQTGYYRRGFRAPHTPAATRARRILWLDYTLQSTLLYEQDLAWYAAWAAYLPMGRYSGLDILLAAAIDGHDMEGQVVFEILTASARGEHPIGAMGRHVTGALLMAHRPDGWAFVERLLIAAQRQEGLRQAVLEAVDEAQPEAFRSMLRLIVQNNLTRFSATVRAAAVWFGFMWDEVNPKRVQEVLVRALAFLEQPQARALALAGTDAPDAHLALWAAAFEDAPATIDRAAALLSAPEPARRFVAVHALSQIALPEAYQALLPALDDADLQVAGYAFLCLQPRNSQIHVPDLFERFERVLPRFSRAAKTPEPLVWPWLTISISQADVAGALANLLNERSPDRLIPYLSLMDANARAHAARQLAKTKTWSPELRQLFLKLIGDSSQGVRSVALEAVGEQQVDPEELHHLETLLARKASDLRRGLIQLILAQPDPAVFGAAERLLAGAAQQRLAALELLERLKNANRLPDLCQALGRRFQAQHPTPTAAEAARLERLQTQAPRQTATLDDALGLMDPTQRTPAAPPAIKAMPSTGSFEPLPPLVTTTAAALCEALDALIDEHRDDPVELDTQYGHQALLLGELRGLPSLAMPTLDWDEPDENFQQVPLQTLWEQWWTERPVTLRDADGLELLRAIVVPDVQPTNPQAPQHQTSWEMTITLMVADVSRPLTYPSLVNSVLHWLLRRYPQPEWAPDFVLDAAETTFALIPNEQLLQPVSADDAHPARYMYWDWRHHRALLAWYYLALFYHTNCPGQWTRSHMARLWGLGRWLDEPAVSIPASRQGLSRHQPSLALASEAYAAGAASEADLLDLLFEPGAGYRQSFQNLRQLSGRKPDKLGQHYAFLGPLLARCRARILEIELERGDTPTAASGPALALRWSGGLSALVKLLAASRGEGLVRGHLYTNQSRDAVFSHLIRVSFPDEADTPEAFAEAVSAAKLPASRLIELAMFAPQWAAHVECALGWPGLASAVWWLHAHTKDRRWYLDQHLLEAWTAEIGEYTPLNASDLMDGAVDVGWFNRARARLAAEQWEKLYAAASFTSSGNGHARARLFADAMAGSVAQGALMKRILDKRHQDAVRALGLLPLADGAAREEDLMQRYQAVQEFRRGTRKFGSQRQASEKLAARIGLENLARTAGYTDPQRLEWAMEAHSAADLAQGALVASVGEVSITLAIDELGEPQLAVARGERLLKAIPPVVKKDPGVAALLERKRDLDRQKARVRQSLEEAMCRGDTFSAVELQGLFAHPLLAPMLSQLVFVEDSRGDALGYPAAVGRILEDQAGHRRLLDPDATLRLAHPHDLLASGSWTAWQRECFAHERIQPFKQIFRELYVLTSAERDSSPRSRRYAGHQVNPRQAMALLTTRGWLAVPGEGIRRTFHAEGFSAWLELLNGAYTPAEMGGLMLEGVSFFHVGESTPMPLAEVPPRIFSEVMRDLDLVVSVAHLGGVDPEASASTVEMRSTLIQETCAMLKLTNVRLQGPHALVDGELGHYSVHLGSAVVHRLPGGALCIVPVHSQQRGRLFLPFADDDPKTAETVSKILLLARDKEIQDPSILEQILA